MMRWIVSVVVVLLVIGSCGDDREVGVATPTLPSVTPGGFLASPEGSSGTTEVYDLPVYLSDPTTVPVTVEWATVDSHADSRIAQAGTDFVAASGTVTFAPGETTQSIQIEIIADTVDETPLLWGEWGLVAFGEPSNAVLDTATFFGHGLFIIIDDDPSPG